MKYLLTLNDDNKYILSIVEAAMRYGQLHIVQYLLEIGIDVTKRGYFKLSPQYGHMELTIFLLDKGILTKERALLSAALGGQLDIVHYLVDNGANIHFHDDEALVNSAINGHFEVIRYLVEKGAIAHDEQYGSALEAAVSYGNLDIIKYLVENCIIQNLTDEQKYEDDQPLMSAVFKGRLDIVQYLMETIYDKQVATHFFYETSQADKLEICKYFYSNFDVDIRYSKDKTLLSFMDSNNREAVKYLLSLYQKDQLKEILNKERRRKIIITFLLKNNASNYPVLIDILREIGIDIYELIEKETELQNW